MEENKCDIYGIVIFYTDFSQKRMGDGILCRFQKKAVEYTFKEVIDGSRDYSYITRNVTEAIGAYGFYKDISIIIPSGDIKKIEDILEGSKAFCVACQDYAKYKYMCIFFEAGDDDSADLIYKMANIPYGTLRQISIISNFNPEEERYYELDFNDVI